MTNSSERAGDRAGVTPRQVIAAHIFSNADRWDFDDEGVEAADSVIAALDLCGFSISPSSIETRDRAGLGIYIASKTKHADRWRALRDNDGLPIISTWIDEAGEGQSADLHDLWHRCLTEASSCAALIVYREKDDVLKGGWVEVGAALAAGRPVYAVGLDGFTIAKYRGITHFPDMKSAVTAALRALSPIETRAPGDGDLGIVLSALRQLEEATGEKFDDVGGDVAAIERDWNARNLKTDQPPSPETRAPADE